MKKIISVTIILLMIGPSLTAQWKIKAAGMPGSPQLGINEMIAVDNKVAWALAYERNNSFVNPLTDFTRTIDGGDHWIPGSIRQFPDQFLLGIAPLSALKAYVISCDGDFVGKVLKTSDGGIKWVELKVAKFPMFYQNIYFFNKNDGVVIGDTVLTSDDHDMVVFLTHDGGNSWKQVPDANLPFHDITENWYIFSSTVIGNTIWTVSTAGRVWKSADKGLHWSASQTAETEAVVSNIKMRDARHGLWGINDELYRTSDGGVTWKEVEVKGTFFTFDLSYVPGTTSTWVSTGGDTSDVDFFTGGLHGLGSSYSVDDGETWVTIDTAVDHLAIAMVSPFRGYCGGFNTGRNDGVFSYAGPALGYSCGSNHTYMCHKGTTICVENSSIPLHLRNGDYLGACNSNNQKTDNNLAAKVDMDERIEATLLRIAPNPVSTSTLIVFNLAQTQKVSVKIFNINGALIKILADEQMVAGLHEITWNVSSKVSTGTYLVKIETGNDVQTRKLVVARR